MAEVSGAVRRVGIRREKKEKTDNSNRIQEAEWEDEEEQRRKIGRGELKLRLKWGEMQERKRKELGRSRRGYFCDAIRKASETAEVHLLHLLSCAQPRLNYTFINWKIILAIAYSIKWTALSFYYNVAQSGWGSMPTTTFSACAYGFLGYYRDEEKSKKQ